MEKADPAFTATPPGYGPRHMAIHEDFGLAYVIYELQSYIGVYEIDKTTGKLTEKFMVKILEETGPGDTSAEVYIAPNKKMLYATNRGLGALVVFAIEPTGNLDKIQVILTWLMVCCWWRGS